MASTSTGRLASTDPNLQNIPIRTEEGRRIRSAFVAEKGNELISADYSQIELRLLAHIADIPQLKKAFADGLDIHAMTASEIFGVPVKGMPPEVRRRAKAINFGIVYGISAFGLANQLGIAREEAGDYIKKYFTALPRHPRLYGRRPRQFAREHGYVETLFGRRIHIREINSSNPGFRGGAERAAINAPIQGARRRHHPPRHDPRARCACRKASSRRACCFRCMTNWCSRRPQKEAEKTCALVTAVMEKAALPALALIRAADRRGARRRRTGTTRTEPAGAVAHRRDMQIRPDRPFRPARAWRSSADPRRPSKPDSRASSGGDVIEA